MNKKAILVENKTAVIILAGLFLILMFGIIGYNLGWFKSLASFIPGIEIPIRKGVEVSYIGYNLETDALAYYDGTKWIAIPYNLNNKNEIVPVGKWYINPTEFFLSYRKFYEGLSAGWRNAKDTSSNRLMPDVNDLYFKDRGYISRGNIIASIPELSVLMVDGGLVSGMTFNGISYPYCFIGRIIPTSELRGNVEINPFNQKPSYFVYDEFALCENNEIIFRGTTYSQGGNPSGGYNVNVKTYVGSYLKIRDFAIKWRDSILSGGSSPKPLKVNIGEKSNSLKEVSYCVQRISDYLVIKLDLPGACA